jgi:predicted nucleotidyltransferase
MILFENVRLDFTERDALVHALTDVKDGVYLFGSRTNPAGRGGDIDLVIFSQQDSFALSRKITRRFFLKCEEKIDVMVFDPQNISEEQKAFLNTLQMVKIQ